MATTQFQHLSTLRTGTTKLKIKVRLTRMWESIQWNNNNEVFSRDFLLLDAKGTHIHARLESKDFKEFDKFAKGALLEEGNIYVIERFDVGLATTYRPVVHPFVIKFKPETLIQLADEGGAEIARYNFNFIEFNTVPEKVKQKTLLSDVIGVLKKVGSTKQKTGSVLKEIVLMDQKRAEVTITLWGDLVGSIPDGILTQQNVIIIATSLAARDYQDKITLSSVSGTKIYVNLDIPAVTEYKRSIEAANILVELEALPQNLSEEALLTDKRVTIGELKEMGRDQSYKGSSYTCSAIIDKVYSTNWYYNCCKRCMKTIAHTEPKTHCRKCRVDSEKKYKLRFAINDFSDITTFVAFNKHAEHLVKKSVEELEIIHKDQGPKAVQTELSKLEGRSYIFQVQITEFSAKEGFESFTVEKVYTDQAVIDCQLDEQGNHDASVESAAGVVEEADPGKALNSELQPSKKNKRT